MISACFRGKTGADAGKTADRRRRKTDRFENKKAKLTLLFTDREGSPLKNRRIRANQTSSAFLFGCGAFDTLEIVNPKSAESKAFYEDRMEKFRELFNYGTLPFYLGRYEPVEGQPMQEVTLSESSESPLRIVLQ